MRYIIIEHLAGSTGCGKYLVVDTTDEFVIADCGSELGRAKVVADALNESVE